MSVVHEAYRAMPQRKVRLLLQNVDIISGSQHKCGRLGMCENIKPGSSSFYTGLSWNVSRLLETSPYKSCMVELLTLSGALSFQADKRHPRQKAGSV